MAEGLESTLNASSKTDGHTVGQTTNSSEQNVPVFKLDPEKPFEIETFCKDIPISVLSKGIRFDLTQIQKENHSKFFELIKSTYTSHSWVSLAADRSYIDISFKEDADSVSALEKPIEFLGQTLYPISILSYKNQLYFIIFRDLPSHLDPVSTKEIILKRVKALGTLIKFTFFEIENTGFLAPLAAAVVQLFEGVPSNGHSQDSSEKDQISVFFKGLIEYCAACQCLGHPHCNFSPPDPSDTNLFVHPSNGHGAGDIMPFPLSAVNSGPPNIPLDLLTNNMVQMPGTQKAVSSQFISFKDIMRNSSDISDNNIVDGLFKNSFGNFGYSNNFGAAHDFSRDALGAYLNGSANQNQGALSQPATSRGGFQTSLNVALYGPSSSTKKPKVVRVPPPRGPNDHPKKRGRPRKATIDGKPSGVMVGPQGRIVPPGATENMLSAESLTENFPAPFSNSNGQHVTTNSVPKRRGRPRKNVDASANTITPSIPTSGTSLNPSNLLSLNQVSQMDSTQQIEASLPFQQLSSTEFANIQNENSNQPFQSLTDLQPSDFSAVSLGVSGVSYMPQYFQNLSVAPNSNFSVTELTTSNGIRDQHLLSENTQETSGFHENIPTFSQ